MIVRKVNWCILGVLALIVCASPIEAGGKGYKSNEENIELKHSTVSLGFGLGAAYLAGDAVTTRLGETTSRFLGGGGIRLEYCLTPIVRFDCGFDALFGAFFEYGSRGRGYAYTLGCRLVHNPDVRSSLFLRGELGTVVLGIGDDYDNQPDVDRSCILGRIGIGQQYYVSSSSLTYVELIFTGIKTGDQKRHPYVGVTDENIYYIMLRVSWIFGL